MTNLLAAFSLLGTILLTGACGRLDMQDRTTPLSEGARCVQLEGKRFVSVETQGDCGPVPAGSQIECRWTVGFAAKDAQTTSFTFISSDIGDSGEVSCVGDVVIQNGGHHTGSYDPNTGELEWNGIVYAAP